jgi:hypothetical protein
MAEVLTDYADEIIFVDYNTPDDYPTFPEAIADTLTQKAISKLRILRVRSEIHEKLYADKTHLKALEAIARNVAIRRSNPKNRWILSTNTDMIFITKDGLPLNNYVDKLSDGFYCAPRMEIPETIWESYDRKNPYKIINDTREYGEKFHLNEIVYGNEVILYDGPGDFQLMLRSDLFEIKGFHERMLLGWHLDSNISKRLKIKYGVVEDAGPFVYGYHCDHTRQITASHAYKSPENSANEFVENVNSFELHEQSITWGLNGYDIEEINIKKSSADYYLNVLDKVIKNRLYSPNISYYKSKNYGYQPIDFDHVLVFIYDLLINSAPSLKICYNGSKRLRELVSECIAESHFINKKIYDFNLQNCLDEKNLIIIYEYQNDLNELNYYLDQLYRLEKERSFKNMNKIKFIAVNVVHNDAEGLINKVLNCAKTPFSTRLRHGYVQDDLLKPISMDLIGKMNLINAIRKNDELCVKNAFGHVVYGPYIVICYGNYSLNIIIETFEKLSQIQVEIVSKDFIIKNDIIEINSKSQRNIQIDFFLNNIMEDVEFRISNLNAMEFKIKKIFLEGRKP